MPKLNKPQRAGAINVTHIHFTMPPPNSPEWQIWEQGKLPSPCLEPFRRELQLLRYEWQRRIEEPGHSPAGALP